ncbi:MAG: NADH-dependent [FeFe] hydrogenase, group A6 [Kiritimatiellae bacterium]|nr:NADH-dependent [FeFe] hydrogenase, group A6 [Kiritimatiellia bacterium]
MVQLEINNIPVGVPAGTTILKAAQSVQIKIPTLCYHPDLKPWAACGICVVRLEGSPKLLRACCTAVAPGMKIKTHDADIVRVRRIVLELMLSNHPNDCLQCPRSGNCELQSLASDFGIREIPFPMDIPSIPIDNSSPSIVLNQEKCIKCGRCAIVCQEMQNVWALEFIGRGENTRMAPAADVLLNDSPCIKCGQCSAHCPVGAIYEHDHTRPVWDALCDEDKFCVVQIAPAVRVAIGEAFDQEPGTIMTGQTYAGLRRIGFNAVFDTNFSADLTIMEEGSEFIERFTKGGTLPLITSCCPAWTDWMEKYANDFIDNFSSAKSPQQMLGVMAKTYYAEKMGIDPSKIYMVSIMPCTAKKYEITRSENMFASGHQDIDVVLTTREAARMFKSAGIDFVNLPEEEPDSILGEYTGAGTLFGVTGGVMEAALRTAYCLITAEDQPPSINFDAVRGMEGVKEAEIDIKGTKVRIAVAHQMGNVEQVLNAIREDRKNGVKPRYDFIEVMACRGGCIGGGGQPLGATDEIRKKRIAGLYRDDEKSTIRMSHLNPQIQKAYDEYLGTPLSEKAHKLLHNHYHAKKLYNK